MKQLFFSFITIAFFSACSNSDKTAESTTAAEKHELLKKVSTYSNDSIVAVTYFSTDTNWTELAKALWQEKTKLLAGKDSTTIYYLTVFNDLDNTPDITTNLDKAWNDEYNNYRVCTIDNSMMFTRFCYQVRYDMGRIGDWAHVRSVNDDGTLAPED